MNAEQLFQIIGELFTENRLLRQEIAKLQKEITELKPKEVKTNGKYENYGINYAKGERARERE